jgi:DNA primase small subunit
MEYDSSQLPELLKQYYIWLFPFDKYYQWLSYGDVDKKIFTHREFSFTLEGDIYVRYQSFRDLKEMESEIRRCNPHKIDIGAVFTAKPCDHKRINPNAFKPVSKELVFDIDMTDYDDVRTCCSEANICIKCWKYIVLAMKVVDRALREDFGFRHLFWVYSGRRGVHCWVCDQVARELTQEARTAVADYLSLVKGGAAESKKVNLEMLPNGKLHWSIVKALEITKKHFGAILKEQDFLSTDEQLEKVLGLLPFNLQGQLREEFSSPKAHSTDYRWRRIQAELSSNAYRKGKYSQLLDELTLQYSYPRLDVNVTKGLNHLLKSPFCVHPKTGRVCIPIDMKEVDHFDPTTVPTVSQLCTELNESEMETGTVSTPSRTNTRRGVCTCYLLRYSETSLQRPPVYIHRRIQWWCLWCPGTTLKPSLVC